MVVLQFLSLVLCPLQIGFLRFSEKIQIIVYKLKHLSFKYIPDIQKYHD